MLHNSCRNRHPDSIRDSIRTKIFDSQVRTIQALKVHVYCRSHHFYVQSLVLLTVIYMPAKLEHTQKEQQKHFNVSEYK